MSDENLVYVVAGKSFFTMTEARLEQAVLHQDGYGYYAVEVYEDPTMNDDGPCLEDQYPDGYASEMMNDRNAPRD